MTFDEFLKKALDIEEDLKRDHLSSGERVAGCHIMHRELQLDQTPDERAGEAVERLRGMGIDADPDSLDFTTEHARLHEWFQRIIFESQLRGAGSAEILATMFVLGRRWGMREAAQALDSFSFEEE